MMLLTRMSAGDKRSSVKEANVHVIHESGRRLGKYEGTEWKLAASSKDVWNCIG